MSLFGKNKNIEVSNQISKSEKKVVMETIDPINFMGDLFLFNNSLKFGWTSHFSVLTARASHHCSVSD